MLKQLKKGTRIQMENIEINLAAFDHFKSEILSKLKRVKYWDLVDLVFTVELTND